MKPKYFKNNMKEILFLKKIVIPLISGNLKPSKKTQLISQNVNF
jgi:hypothetical protein